MEKVTKEVSLTLTQWKQVMEALDCYEYLARRFLNYREGQNFRDEYILPVYEQMPDEVF